MAFLRAFGSAVPQRVVTNDDLAARTGRDAATIEKNTGIRERRYADEGVSIADLGLAAAQDCLNKAGLTADEVGLILFSCGSIERCFPGPAATVAAKLGLATTPAIDLPIASAGALVGMSLAADLAAQYGNVLVVAAEIMSRRISDADADTAILFGDGAGACVVSRDAGFARIVDSAIHTDGNYAESLSLPLAGTLHMEGLQVIMQASRKVPRVIGDLVARHGLTPEQVGVFLMHQANQNLLRKVAATLKVPEERFYSTIARYGNTSSASMLIAAAEWHAGLEAAPTQPLVFAAFGAGFSWGALLAVPVG